MESLPELYLKLGDELAAKGDHEEALSCYQKAMEQSCDSEEVVTRLDKNYILPQEKAFRDNFAKNCKDININFNYEDCKISFIALSDKNFVMFDREAKRFCGSADFSTLDIESREKTFQSVLAADIWDGREILDILNRKLWNHVYIVMNDSARKFMSFFMLPDFTAFFSENVHIFLNTQEMDDYLSGHSDVYLPHVFFSPNQEKYECIIEKIHQQRLKREFKGNTAVLSVCIPSYNRGELALEAVQSAAKAKYDIEIEILVSNNGSTLGKEGYKTIQDMKDSRIRYYEFEKNQGFKANVFKCLREARGKFAFLLADEDLLDSAKLDEVFDFLLNTDNVGVCKFNPSEQFRKDLKIAINKKYKKGGEAFSWASNFKYFSGYCYNVELMKKYHVIEQLEKIDSPYCYDYPTCAPMCLLAEVSDMEESGICVWYYRKPAEVGGNLGTEINISSYTSISSRLEYQKNILELAEKELEFEDYKTVLLSCPHRTLSALSLCMQTLGADSWLDICLMEYKNCLEIIRESKWGIEAFDQSFFQKFDMVFLDWLDCRRIRPLYSEQENFIATLRTQIAGYCCNHDIPFLKIDFEHIDEKLDQCLSGLC